MKNKHLSDAAIQQYILQKTNSDPDVIEHIESCANCKTRAEQYSILFEGIKQQERPVFEFNLADLVMDKLPTPQHKLSYEKLFSYFIIFISIFVAVVILYFFGSNLLNLFSEIKPVLIGLVITTVTSLLLFLCIDMNRKYQAQMKALDFY